MSISDLITILGNHPLALSALFLGLPLISWLYGIPLSKSKAVRSPHSYTYALLVYLTAIPGAFSLALTGYVLFFLKANLLSVNLVVFFLPMLSMVITLTVIRAKVDLNRLPGFDRIIGLFTLLLVTFILVLLIEKTRIWVLFHGSMTTLVLFVLFLFFLLRWASSKLFSARK